jgi:hypothetical protein
MRSSTSACSVASAPSIGELGAGERILRGVVPAGSLRRKCGDEQDLGVVRPLIGRPQQDSAASSPRFSSA